MFIVVDRKELADVQRTLNATNAQVQESGTRAMNSTISWAQRSGQQTVIAAHGLPMKSFGAESGRVLVRRASKRSSRASVWFGIDPIRAIHLDPRQTATGVTAAGQEFRGGFIATMTNGHRGVFVRKGRARLPIKEQSVSLPKAEQILKGMQSEVPDRVRKSFLRHIDRIVNVRGY